jgi:SHS2 domain-containing protein
MSSFEEIDHTADWAFRVRSSSLEGLFLAAMEAIYTLGGVQAGSPAQIEREIQLEAEDAESLLVAWLNEALYLLENQRIALVGLCWEDFSPTALRAKGKPAAVTAVGKYIKAATYSGLKILRTDKGFEATIVLDV